MYSNTGKTVQCRGIQFSVKVQQCNIEVQQFNIEVQQFNVEEQ